MPPCEFYGCGSVCVCDCVFLCVLGTAYPSRPRKYYHLQDNFTLFDCRMVMCVQCPLHTCCKSALCLPAYDYDFYHYMIVKDLWIRVCIRSILIIIGDISMDCVIRHIHFIRFCSCSIGWFFLNRYALLMPTASWKVSFSIKVLIGLAGLIFGEFGFLFLMTLEFCDLVPEYSQDSLKHNPERVNVFELSNFGQQVSTIIQ